MVRETSHSAPREAASQAVLALEAPKKHLLAKVGLAAGTLAAAFTAATAHPNKALATAESAETARTAHPLDYIGVTSNRIWDLDLDVARQAAKDIAAANANTVRIFQPYNLSQAEFSFDLPRLCHAAEAARENNLTLEISFLGVQKVMEKNKRVLKHNYVPGNAGGVSRYLHVAKTILLDIAGPNANRPGPNGAPPCVQEPLTKVIIEDFDEVNSEDFNSNTNPAKSYAYLESRAIPAYAKIAADINAAFEGAGTGPKPDEPHFTLVHAVGALAAANHDPVGFLRDFDKALKGFGVQNPGFLLAVHPYPKDSKTNPSQVEANLYPLIKAELDSAWGANKVSIFYDEIGVPAISPKKRGLYGPRSLQAAAVDEGAQAQYYRDAINEASLEDGVVGELTFQSQDEQNDGWPSGIYDPKGGRKSSWNTVADTFYRALQGTLQK